MRSGEHMDIIGKHTAQIAEAPQDRNLDKKRIGQQDIGDAQEPESWAEYIQNESVAESYYGVND